MIFQIQPYKMKKTYLIILSFIFASSSFAQDFYYFKGNSNTYSINQQNSDANLMKLNDIRSHKKGDGLVFFGYGYVWKEKHSGIQLEMSINELGNTTILSENNQNTTSHYFYHYRIVLVSADVMYKVMLKLGRIADLNFLAGGALGFNYSQYSEILTIRSFNNSSQNEERELIINTVDDNRQIIGSALAGAEFDFHITKKISLLFSAIYRMTPYDFDRNNISATPSSFSIINSGIGLRFRLLNDCNE